MMTYFKKVLLLGIISCVFYSFPAIADTVRPEGGEAIECVILSEKDGMLTCQTASGKITMPQKKLTTITRASDAENTQLKNKWKKEKAQYLKKIAQPVTEVKKTTGTVLHDGVWYSYDEYDKLKKEIQLDNAARLLVEDHIEKVQTQERDEAERRAATEEAIKQGMGKRSRLGRTLLSHGEWFMESGNACRIFYANPDDQAQINDLILVADHYGEAIGNTLEETAPLCFSKMLEIFLITDTDVWQDMVHDAPEQTLPNSFRDEYHNEIFLFRNIEDTEMPSVLIHELAHLIVREYVTTHFSKKHRIPLWLVAGIAQYHGKLSRYALTRTEMQRGIRRNYYLRLDTLLERTTLPEKKYECAFFYTESASLIEFILFRYGQAALNTFIATYLEKVQPFYKKESGITAKMMPDIFDAIRENTFLEKYFNNYSAFEQEWLKYISKER